MVLFGAADMMGDADVAHRLADIDESLRGSRRQTFSRQEYQPLHIADMHERQNVHAMYDAWDAGFPRGEAADDASLALMGMHDVRPPFAHETLQLPECRNVMGRRQRGNERVKCHHPKGLGNRCPQNWVVFLAMNHRHLVAVSRLSETTRQRVLLGARPKQAGQHMDDLHRIASRDPGRR